MKTGTLRLSLLLSGVAVGLASTADAHHSFAALYDANQPIHLVGTLTRVEWTNPHSYFHLDVTGADGQAANWAVETAGPGALARRGLSRHDVRIGDVLIVDGYPAKSGAHVADGRFLTLPDGRVINDGTPEDGSPGDPPTRPNHR